MFQEERLQAILQYLTANKRITVDQICELYDVSRDTARRDMVKLEEQGTIVRTRGGAILPTLSKDIGNYEQRMQEASTSKLTIGKTAASLVQDGNYLMMDASTTVLHAAASLRSKHNVVVTNSIETAAVLTRNEEITIHMLGGVLDKKHHRVWGAKTLEMIHDYHVDKLFIGTCGITEEGLSAPDEEDSYIVRTMMEHADQVIVLADHTKFGKRLFHRVVGFDRIDILITDQEVSSSMRELLIANEVKLVLAGGEDRHD
ncbi:DeoR/GlpR family DNA-binding transcription regulator [Paenibacillus whitsoniae]|uniref:DeoR/GlpR transcriptional regulator n=1 Tax=Paenibacillus whitsoniae TaxID=2496558 RepID=A0A3S0BGN8_9BACL|nr:DeoR/GlpR family DNA-binding transcription regulator [Paenibacillus whitsoniae]RTE02236.1 DeoR/GlpR transcriptional regulator [Paenibacillus whitsoniae]